MNVNCERWSGQYDCFVFVCGRILKSFQRGFSANSNNGLVSHAICVSPAVSLVLVGAS